jgi:hypothetical protein
MQPTTPGRETVYEEATGYSAALVDHSAECSCVVAALPTPDADGQLCHTRAIELRNAAGTRSRNRVLQIVIHF